MGRWSNKDSTDDYYSLSTKFLRKHRYFESAGMRSGLVSWSRGGEVRSSVGVQVVIYTTHGEIRFQYTSTDRSSREKIERDYTVQLVSTLCNYGGVRWWFICPLVRNGVLCQRRVGVLYLGSAYFGCRNCFELVYQSSKDSHKLDRMFLSLGLDPKIGNKMFAQKYL